MRRRGPGRTAGIKTTSGIERTKPKCLVTRGVCSGTGIAFTLGSVTMPGAVITPGAEATGNVWVDGESIPECETTPGDVAGSVAGVCVHSGIEASSPGSETTPGGGAKSPGVDASPGLGVTSGAMSIRGAVTTTGSGATDRKESGCETVPGYEATPGGAKGGGARVGISSGPDVTSEVVPIRGSETTPGDGGGTGEGQAGRPVPLRWGRGTGPFKKDR